MMNLNIIGYSSFCILHSPFIILHSREPSVGFEPTTYCLQNSCSTTELQGHHLLNLVFQNIQFRILRIEHAELLKGILGKCFVADEYSNLRETVKVCGIL